MNEFEIQQIVRSVIDKMDMRLTEEPETSGEKEIVLEASARHVHLTKEAVESLFGKGALLKKKKDLSQPGEFLSEQRVRLVTSKGTIENVAVLGPERKSVQVELSATDCRALGVRAPVNLSGDLSGAGDVHIVGDSGLYDARSSVIIAKNHIHMTPDDAERFGVSDSQSVRVRVSSCRPVTFDDVTVRVNSNFALAMHIDFDEANACMLGKDSSAKIL